MAIKVKFRRTSCMRMRIVKDGHVHVSAPIGMPREEVIEFINENREWIRKARQKYFELQEKSEEFYALLPLYGYGSRERYKKELKALIEPMVERYSKIMGVTPGLISYYESTTRWGDIDIRNGDIRFSVYLLLLPKWCVEHTVVHELCHLLEPSHNAHFHELMDKYFPRWREARKETRRAARLASVDDD